MSTAPKKPLVGVPFKKGQSGNPSGRPKIVAEIRSLAQERGPEAFQRLVDWMNSDNPKASVSAANSILDRAYGKPAQAVTGEGGEGPIKHVLEVVWLGRMKQD